MAEVALAHGNGGRRKHPGRVLSEIHHLAKRLGDVKRRHRHARFVARARNPAHQGLFRGRHRLAGVFKPLHPLPQIQKQRLAGLHIDGQILAHLYVRRGLVQQQLEHQGGVFEMLGGSLHALERFNIAAVALKNACCLQAEHEIVERLSDGLTNVVPARALGCGAFEFAHQHRPHAVNDFAHGRGGELAAKVIGSDVGQLVGFVEDDRIHARQHAVVLAAFELHGRG